MGDAKSEEWVRRVFDLEVRRVMEAELWEPCGKHTHLLSEEMREDPDGLQRLIAASAHPRPDFPYRDLSEEEVRAFAQGVGHMVANAWKANEAACAKRDSDLELHYRVQAEAQKKVLTLLERVLRGEYPPRGAN